MLPEPDVSDQNTVLVLLLQPSFCSLCADWSQVSVHKIVIDMLLTFVNLPEHKFIKIFFMKPSIKSSFYKKYTVKVIQMNQAV